MIPRLTAQLVTLMQPCGTIFCSYKSTPKIFFIMLLCPYRSYIMSTPVPAHEGRRPEAVLKVERGLASRGRGLHHGLGRLGNRSPGTTTRAARSSLHVLRRNWRGRKRGPEAENRQEHARRSFSEGGWSAERRASPIARGRGRLASARHAALWRVGGASQAPPRLSALRSPSLGGADQRNENNPGAKTRRGNEMLRAWRRRE